MPRRNTTGAKSGTQRARRGITQSTQRRNAKGAPRNIYIRFRLNSFEYFANIPLSNFHLILWELCVSSLRTLRLFLCVLCVSSFAYFASLPFCTLRLFLCVLCVSSFACFASLPLCTLR